jgi:hypothetical protein
MKLQIPCHECTRIGFEKDKDKTAPYFPSHPYWEFPVIELEKWPFIEVVCKQGHQQRLMIDLELYELLFQQGTYCLMDGYYRESIGTYSSALERFFEYVIEILCIHCAQTIYYDTLWNKIKNQSERQLGAYYYMWSSRLNSLPNFLDENMVKIRNSVVHKGELASRETSLEYGKYVFEYIREANAKLLDYLGEDLWIFKMHRMHRIAKVDIEQSFHNPIKSVIDGEEVVYGLGSMSIPCFLNSNEYSTYKSCFADHKSNNIGLLNR